MRHPEKAENPIARLVMAKTVQNFVDNPYYLWKEGCSDTELENLKKYLRAKEIPVPIIPADDRAEDTKRAIYLIWAALECNNCICALMGCEE